MLLAALILAAIAFSMAAVLWVGAVFLVVQLRKMRGMFGGVGLTLPPMAATVRHDGEAEEAGVVGEGDDEDRSSVASPPD